MVGIISLWLPILISAVGIFVVSSVIHMFLPWHKNDYKRIPDEDKVMDALRPFNIPPGDYFAPRAESMADMKSEAFAEKLKKGPVFISTFRPNGRNSMSSSLVLWFLYSLVIGIFAAYVASRALHADITTLGIARFTGVTAFLGYSCSIAQMSIWYGRSWGTTIKSMIDGFIYACLTAAIFIWLWPAM